jgi:hypothetical protein
MDELRLTIRFFVLIAAGLLVMSHLAVVELRGWLGVLLPDPAFWLWTQLSHLA